MNIIIALLCSVLMLLVFSFTFSVSILSYVFYGTLFFFLFYWERKRKMKFQKSIFFTALLFAFFIEIGLCFVKAQSITYLCSSIFHLFTVICRLLFFTYFFYVLLSFLLEKFNHSKSKKPKSRILQFLFYRHPFVSAFFFTLSISLLYLLFFYPGSMTYDGLWQLDFYYGILPFNNHHPAGLTFIMGFLMDLGRGVNDNFGMFLFILPQMILNAFVYAYVLKIMNQLDTPFLIRFFSLLFYACFPLLAINSITYIKDVLFYLFFLLFFVYLYYHFYLSYEKIKKSHCFILLLISFGMYLTRNTGFYILFITTLTFFVFFFKRKRSVSYFFLAFFILNIFVEYSYHHVFLEKLNILEGSVREMMSVPLQQTGRYLKYYPNDLSKHEKEVLNHVFRTDFVTLGLKYNPNRSDNIKWEFLEYPSRDELMDYFGVWFSMFFKHPIIYVDATLNNTYGYFYPNVQNFIGEALGFYGIKVSGRVNKGTFHFQRNHLEEGRVLLESFSSRLSKAPYFHLLYAPAFYVWILLVLSIQIIALRKKSFYVLLIPLYVVLLFCLVSPVNAHMRYLQPIMVSIPFLLAIYKKESKQ